MKWFSFNNDPNFKNPASPWDGIGWVFLGVAVIVIIGLLGC